MEVLAAIVLFFVLTLLIIAVRKKKVDSNTLQDWANLVTVSSVISAVFLGLIVGTWYFINPAKSVLYPSTATLTIEQPTSSSVTETVQPTSNVVDTLSPIPTETNLQPTETLLPTMTPTLVNLVTSMTPTVQLINTQADTGWQGEYYNNEKFEDPVAFKRIDSEINFDWKEGNPAPGIPIDNFSIRWTRCLNLEERYYIFIAHADDYLRVFVDDIQVLETSLNMNIERSFAVSAGQHCIKVEYRENGGVASAYLFFKAGESFNIADESTAWKGEYFNNKDFLGPVTYIRNDPAPIFDWKEGNPAPNIPIDGFSVRWTRCLDLEGRDYVFTAHADDYVRVLVDDIQVLEAPLHANVERSFAVSAGRHCIKVEYREDGGFASVYLYFK